MTKLNPDRLARDGGTGLVSCAGYGPDMKGALGTGDLHMVVIQSYGPMQQGASGRVANAPLLAHANHLRRRFVGLLVGPAAGFKRAS